MTKLSKAILFLVILALVAATLGAPDKEGKRKYKHKHPGCFVWWFSPGCPLAKVLGVDPLGIYPWKKFCVIYSDFEKSEVCIDILTSANSTTSNTTTTSNATASNSTTSTNMTNTVNATTTTTSNTTTETNTTRGRSIEHQIIFYRLDENEIAPRRFKRSPGAENPHDAKFLEEHARQHGDVNALNEMCANNAEFANRHADLCSANNARNTRSNQGTGSASASQPRDAQWLEEHSKVHGDARSLAENCANNPDFAKSHQQLCKNDQNRKRRFPTGSEGTLEATAHHDQRWLEEQSKIRGDLTNLAELCTSNPEFLRVHADLCAQSQNRRNSEINSITFDHPGCTSYFFLPNCPLASIFGVDPFRHYPWDSLCQYRSLEYLAQCRNRQINFAEKSYQFRQAAKPIFARKSPLFIVAKGGIQ